ncbi:hypothetical protein F8M41_024802 [Gigaspora margarita]|uniref:Uncharacterized protein n=1 Tax=Gigaspora margarita TaxID=4874 RepID=A0A8H4ET99_GIGMA|nr:hypothetical protein F8M41_024802 [Gigaspora margarita]
MNHTDEIRDPKGCQTRTRVAKVAKKDKKEFEKACTNQDKLLKVEVKDAEALVYQGFRRKQLASESQRWTYLGNEQDKIEPTTPIKY